MMMILILIVMMMMMMIRIAMAFAAAVPLSKTEKQKIFMQRARLIAVCRRYQPQMFWNSRHIFLSPLLWL